MHKHVFIILSAIFITLYIRTFVEAARPLAFKDSLPWYHISLLWPKHKDYDSHKLAIAISYAETGGPNHRDGTAIHRNNCCGVMKFWIGQDGKRHREPKYYAKYEDSLKEVAAIWNRHYGRFPDLDLATRWNGEPEHAKQWLATVQKVYPTL